MTNQDDGASVGPGSREPDQQAVPALSGFDPSRATVLIPREPTEAMMDAGLYHSSHDSTWADVHTIWKAMFDAFTLDGGTSEHAMVEFGASAVACYLYPGEGQQAERAAFCAGAAHSVKWLANSRDSDGSPKGTDPQGLDGEAATAGAGTASHND